MHADCFNFLIVFSIKELKIPEVQKARIEPWQSGTQDGGIRSRDHQANTADMT